MQKAQPSTLAHYFMAYCEMFFRDIIRLKDCRTRINVLPLGAGALCATSYPIDRAMVAGLLGFDSVSQNSLDAVSDRDFAVEYLSCLSLIMTHLSRISEEIILWSTDEFGYITLPDAFSTGSSMMPQKKNPDICELIRGKTGRVYGHLTALLTTLKGLPLAYNKDMQEDKEALFDAEDTVINCLNIFTAMISAVGYNKDALLTGAKGGYTQATDCADYLVKKGVPFRDAHKIIGGMVLFCVDNRKRLDEMTLDEFKAFSPLFEKDILQTVKVESIIASKKVTGGTNPNTVKAHIKKLRAQLEKL
jgi:argininosuccinate lyase